MHTRQQVLHLWLAGASLDEAVMAWAFHDATDGVGDQLPDSEPPYPSGLDAMRDGWMLIQATPPPPPPEGPHEPSTYLDHEFVLERRFEMRDDTGR